MVGGGYLRIDDEFADFSRRVDADPELAAALTRKRLADGLILAVRQCATHSAGPLAAVAAIGQAVDAKLIDEPGLTALEREVIDYLDGMSMPADRRERVDAFLRVVFYGLSGRPTAG